MAHRTEKFFARFGVLFGAFSYLLFASGAAAQEADQTKSTHLPNGTNGTLGFASPTHTVLTSPTHVVSGPIGNLVTGKIPGAAHSDILGPSNMILMKMIGLCIGCLVLVIRF